MKLLRLILIVKFRQPFPPVYCQMIMEIMKRAAIYLFVYLITAGCNKNSENKSKLEGKWQLSAVFLQTAGPGAWHIQDSIPPNFIQFNHDGSLTLSPYVSTLYNGPLGYTVDNDGF
jgi:hypothetical protein